MNKLLGLYKPQKVDITTDGKAINDITLIKLIEVKKDEGEEVKKDEGKINQIMERFDLEKRRYLSDIE